MSIGPTTTPTCADAPRFRQEVRINDDDMVARIREVYELEDMEAFAKAQYEMASEDLVNEYPQSGERFRGRDNIMAMNQSYSGSTGTKPKAKPDGSSSRAKPG